MVRLLLPALVLVAGAAAPVQAASGEEQCLADIAATRRLIVAMPQDDLSRRFAEHELEVARIELSGGDADECPHIIANARRIIATRPFVLRPGEAFGVQPR